MSYNCSKAKEDDVSVNDENPVDQDNTSSISTDLELEIINETDAIKEKSMALDEELSTKLMPKEIMMPHPK